MTPAQKQRRRLRLYRLLAPLFALCALVALLSGRHGPAVFLLVTYYLLFGFVGLAYAFFKRQNFKAARVFLSATVPLILFPYYRDWYFLMGSSLALSLDKNAEQALALAEQVQPGQLITDNNRCIYYGQRAALAIHFGDRSAAEQFLGQFGSTPHDAQMDPALANLQAAFDRKFAPQPTDDAR